MKDFGCKLDIDYPPAIIKAHVLCSQYGLDVDNTAGPIAWAMECYEKGILKKGDLDGIELDWGNYEGALELIRKIAYRDGVGDLLGEGSKRASEIIGKGSGKYAMHIKGQDLYEVLRTSKGWGLGVILSPRGSGHLRGAPTTEVRRISPEEGERFFGVPTAGDRNAYDGKAKLVIYFENLKAVTDAMNICYILTQWSSSYLINPDDISRLYTAAVGVQITPQELMKIGERIHNVEKAFNAREGITRKDDAPPERFFEPIKSGGGKGDRLERDRLDRALDEYYQMRGWDVKTGLQKRAKLEELELVDIADDLEKRGKLA
jgi:aldehyde:ferredoxin oxidoreductase